MMQRALRLFLIGSTMLVASTCTSHRAISDGGVNEDAIARIERRIEETRGLRFRHRVDVAVLSDAESEAFFQSHASNVSEERWANEDLIAESLGFTPKGTRLSDVLPPAMSDNAGGVYEPIFDDDRRRHGERRGRLHISPDVLPSVITVPANFAGLVTKRALPDEVFIAHEMLHALQDQAFDLTRVLPSGLSDVDSDQAWARKAFVESEANLFTQAYMLGVDLRDDVQRRLLVEYLIATNALDVVLAAQASPALPLRYVRLFVEQYALGLRAISGLINDGGFDALNTAWMNALPSTTHELMFPEQHRGARTEPRLGFAPLVVTPTVTESIDNSHERDDHEIDGRDRSNHAVEDAGGGASIVEARPSSSLPKRIRTNTLGAFSLLVLLESHTDVDARDVVSAWRADRYDVFQSGASSTSLTHRSSWASVEAATNARHALTRLLAKKGGWIEARDRPPRGEQDGEKWRIYSRVDDEHGGEMFAAIKQAGVVVATVENLRREEIDAFLSRVDEQFHPTPSKTSPDSPTSPTTSARSDDDVPSNHGIGASRTAESLIDDKTTATATVRHHLSERIHLPHRRLSVRLGAGVALRHVGPHVDGALLLDREIRWGVRPWLEWAPPFLVTARVPTTLENLVVTTTFGVSHVGFSLEENIRPAFDVRGLVLVGTTLLLDEQWGLTVQGGGETALLSTDLTLHHRARVAGAVLWSLFDVVIVHAGVALTTPLPQSSSSASASEIVLGSATWRGRVPTPLVEWRLGGGFSLFAVSEVSVDPTRRILKSQRHAVGVQLLF